MGTEIAFVESGMCDEAVGQCPMDFGDLRRATSSTAKPGPIEPKVANTSHAVNYSQARGDPHRNLPVRGLQVWRDTHEEPDDQVVEYLAEHSPISIAVEGRMQLA